MYNKSKNLDVKHIGHIMRSTNKLSKKGIKSYPYADLI